MRKICSRFVVVGADGYVSLPAAAETVTIRHLLTHTSGLWDAALYDGRLLPLAAGDLGGEGAVRGQIQAVGNRVFKTDGGVNKRVPRSGSRSRRAGECGVA